MMQSSDILIIGGGLIGLSLAIELKLKGATVTVLSRDFGQAAAHVAAGMLAPQAERISPGPMLDLCVRSRSLYPDWIVKLEGLTGLETGYWSCGILAPVYQVPSSSLSSQSEHLPAQWLDRAAIEQHQPGLGKEVVGGWWYPKDAQVDPRRGLTKVLQAAAQKLGVEIREGVNVEEILSSPQHQVTGLRTNRGHFQSAHYILATGAWSQQLLPVPVYPRKGQMLSVRVPDSYPELPLQQVLFGDNCYIVPRRDGLIVVGATVEDVGFAPDNTPQGIHTLLSQAIRLYPLLKDFPLQEFWWGFRPATPDEWPILGESPWVNLTLAVGHYRNGILLAPITAKLIADWVWESKADPLLKHFSWKRF